jgi:hypothetical protein
MPENYDPLRRNMQVKGLQNEVNEVTGFSPIGISTGLKNPGVIVGLKLVCLLRRIFLLNLQDVAG